MSSTRNPLNPDFDWIYESTRRAWLLDHNWKEYTIRKDDDSKKQYLFIDGNLHSDHDSLKLAKNEAYKLIEGDK